MIDTHCHIDDPQYSEDFHSFVQLQKECGVKAILVPGVNTHSIQTVLEACEQYPEFLFPALGLHPEDVKDNWQQDLATIHHAIKNVYHSAHRKIVAIGEIGLDYYWDKSNEKEQEDAFHRQIEWSIKYQLPLVIHARSAHRRIVDIMIEYRDNLPCGVFHCFGGTEEEASELLQFQGFMLGIGCVLTYKNSNLSKVLTTVPLERIVLETDAPYLSPVPYRGKRNESAYITEVLQKVADIYNVSKQETESITNNNAKRVFRRMTER